MGSGTAVALGDGVDVCLAGCGSFGIADAEAVLVGIGRKVGVGRVVGGLADGVLVIPASGTPQDSRHKPNIASKRIRRLKLIKTHHQRGWF
jgi:hypothetical protein